MQTERDRSIVDWLAVKVKGWHREPSGKPSLCQSIGSWLKTAMECLAAYPDWNPIESWADAGQLWELHGCGCLELTEDGWEAHCTGHRVVADSGPRAICEAVAKATGWEEPT